MLYLVRCSVLVGFALIVACSAGGNASPAGAGGAGGSAGGSSLCGSCIQSRFQPCDKAGNPLPQQDCGAQGRDCVVGQGCLPCKPGQPTCVNNDVHECLADGTPGPLISECDAANGLVCSNGVCSTECDAVAGSPSNVGCEFWAVDLPNERVRTIYPLSAAESPWGVILANAGTTAAEVTVERNLAKFGDPPQIAVVQSVTIPVGGVEPIGLPQAEIVGPTVTEPPGPPGSQFTSNAFRITSTTPLIAYQFNNFMNSYSNDASLLLPRAGLGTLHRVLGYPPSKPVDVAGFPFPGIPERAFVTVIGVEAATQVKIKAGGTVNTDGSKIPNLEIGDVFEATIGPFDVLNIASRGLPGDLTGTVVQSSKKVAVFSSTETSIIGRPNSQEDLCCTDHLEDQIFPVTALGKQFVVTRSPPRGSSDIEPDLLRFLGVAEVATVTTNLSGADAQFTLQPGEMREVWTKTDIVVESSTPITVGQLLISQTHTENFEGDPSLTIYPPIEQYRSSYAFLIPPSWPKNFVVVSSAKSTELRIDGQPLPGACVQVTAGPLAGVDWVATRCPLAEGIHHITGSDRFGITVYGYSGPGSFAFAGGADVKPVYEPPPIF